LFQIRVVVCSIKPRGPGQFRVFLLPVPVFLIDGSFPVDSVNQARFRRAARAGSAERDPNSEKA